MIKAGLVTVLFNSDEVLEGFISSLSKQTFQDFHLYLVDNTPNSKTDSLLYSLIDKYNLRNYEHIKNDTNVGVAKGNNQGIVRSIESSHTYTILLNNDIEFNQTDLLNSIISKAESSKEHMIIPKIYFGDGKKIWMAGGKLFKSTGKTIHVGEGEDDSKRFESDAYFNYAPTCFMLIKTSLFEEIGLMDESYFVYYDDTDFVYRAVEKGYKVLMIHSIHVFHKVSSSTGGGLSLFTIYYGNRNRIYFIRKNFTGFYFGLALINTLITRLLNHLRYSVQQRNKMWQGVNDGLKMKLPK